MKKRFDGADMFLSVSIVVIFTIIIIFIFIGISNNFKETRMQKRAVESGLGHYDTKTGDWKWNTPQLKYTLTGKRK